MESEHTLEFLKRMADGLAVMFGNNCEIVIHNMKDFESSILYIVNGHVTDRQEGGKFDILGTKEIDELFRGTDLVNYKGESKNNHLIKSSTFHIKGEDYHYAFGINYDYTNMQIVHNVVGDLIRVGESIDVAIDKDVNLERKLTELFNQAIDYVGKPLAFMRKKERVQMIKYLNESGAFSIHKSIPIIAEKMNVSRYTIYNYLKEIEAQENNNASRD